MLSAESISFLDGSVSTRTSFSKQAYALWSGRPRSALGFPGAHLRFAPTVSPGETHRHPAGGAPVWKRERRIRYELHITRADDWTDNLGQEIPAPEWLALVEGDAELVADPSQGDHAALWSRSDGRTGFWFDWCDGNVYTANPDRMTLRKVLQIARILRAQVLGDDGAVYTTPGQELPIWELR